MQDIGKLADKIRIEEDKILKVAEQLQGMGLVTLEKGRLKIGRYHLYLDSKSPLIQNHHVNWRHKMIDLLANDKPQNLHFTMTFSVSESDLKKVREILVRSMDQAMSVIKPSPEEKLAVFCLDLHSLI